MQQFTDDVEENISLLVNCYQNTGFTEQQKLVPFWLLWRIWKARNNLVFNKFRESPSRVVLQAQADVKAWINNFANKSTQPLRSSHATPITSTWTKPPPSFVKCNFDAGFDIGTSKGIGGWIIRDHHGIAKAWGSSILPSVSTPLEAETKALLVAIQQSWIRGYRKILFEGDCEILIKALNGLASHCEITNLLHDIDFWTSKFSSVSFTFIRRQCNSAAHFLASYGCNNVMSYSSSNNQPVGLQKLLCNDSNS